MPAPSFGNILFNTEQTSLNSHKKVPLSNKMKIKTAGATEVRLVPREEAVFHINGLFNPTT